MSELLFPVVVLLGFYLLLVRPARARQRAAAQVQAALAPGKRVVTTAGIHATVAQVDPDDGTVLLELAPGVPVRFAAAAVVRVVEEPQDVAAEQEPGSAE